MIPFIHPHLHETPGGSDPTRRHVTRTLQGSDPLIHGAGLQEGSTSAVLLDDLEQNWIFSPLTCAFNLRRSISPFNRSSGREKWFEKMGRG